MKQKLLSFGDDFTIKDQNGRDCYFVDGRVFSIGEKASFQDMQGNELLRIEQKLLSFKKTYNIVRGDKEVARVQKKLFTLFRDAFEIEDDAAGELDATGDFLDREYRFTRDGRTVATVSKRFFAWTDTYGVDIADGEDDSGLRRSHRYVLPRRRLRTRYLAVLAGRRTRSTSIYRLHEYTRKLRALLARSENMPPTKCSN